MYREWGRHQKCRVLYGSTTDKRWDNNVNMLMHNEVLEFIRTICLMWFLMFSHTSICLMSYYVNVWCVYYVYQIFIIPACCKTNVLALNVLRMPLECSIWCAQRCPSILQMVCIAIIFVNIILYDCFLLLKG